MSTENSSCFKQAKTLPDSKRRPHTNHYNESKWEIHQNPILKIATTIINSSSYIIFTQWWHWISISLNKIKIDKFNFSPYSSCCHRVPVLPLLGQSHNSETHVTSTVFSVDLNKSTCCSIIPGLSALNANPYLYYLHWYSYPLHSIPTPLLEPFQLPFQFQHTNIRFFEHKT